MDVRGPVPEPRPPAVAASEIDPMELLASEAYGDVAITAVIRPAAILPERAARQVLVELAHRDVRAGGDWMSTPTTWQRYDQPWSLPDQAGSAQLIGTMQIAYGVPTHYDITIYRATITVVGKGLGWTVEALCDEALGFGGYTLAACPRAELTQPPKPFRLGR
jgi:hypothetical protein